MRDTCVVRCIHQDAVEEARDHLIDDRTCRTVTEIFRLLGDDTRLRILLALNCRELCVCDLSVLLNLSQSAVSHQLRLLRGADLVKFRREGKVVYYSLADDHVIDLLSVGIEHARE
ncbi:ArsR family transcriptional regulator [Methanofollis aquaemaris]|uniref:ArsR family transcriptional regulator n=1 Tax=Methanofollis aquaemaris TaxID=126734 RepID=A0A8A3S1T2_9EURY|nr:metalloregulator ArsR/SmtB family transcription factor [Methanofollis aquaemaris]QSZ66172.1 ArsR family transcriptional regulator [Methanofollis aquaemaris]